jgi:outer membrane protein TolC
VTAQQTALLNERNDIDIERRRMDASVLLIKALGGGWSTANLPKY